MTTCHRVLLVVSAYRAVAVGDDMVFGVDVVLTWILFLALFPMAYFWLRAAWRIGVKKDYSGVALRKGVPPPNPGKFAPYALLLDAAAGAVVVFVILLVVLGQAPYERWTAIAGITIWFKIIGSFTLGYHAHKQAVAGR